MKLHILSEQQEQQFLYTLEQRSTLPIPCFNYYDKIFTVVTISLKCYLGSRSEFHWAANLHENLMPNYTPVNAFVRTYIDPP